MIENLKNVVDKYHDDIASVNYFRANEMEDPHTERALENEIFKSVDFEITPRRIAEVQKYLFSQDGIQNGQSSYLWTRIIAASIANNLDAEEKYQRFVYDTFKTASSSVQSQEIIRF